MRRTPVTRLGAFGLALLMQLFVASSLLHPCCLTGDLGPMGGMESHGTHDAVTDAPHGDHAPDHAHGPGGSADPTPSSFAPAASNGAHAAAHAAQAAAANAHAGHGHSGSGDSDCEGRCGFCCQVAGFAGIPASPIASISAAEIAASIARFPVSEVRASHRAYLAPWANAPPVRFDIV
ncbi:hypothetical protein [Gaopeijia maritima]|uniref:hypothetical protein n=1 Tax=Gaopeijia maritima TaxID=3119007 RepID=UPI00327D4C91